MNASMLRDEAEGLENGLAVPVAIYAEHRPDETCAARRIQEAIVDVCRNLIPAANALSSSCSPA